MVSRVNLNVNISVKRLVHDGVKVIFNVRKQRERHSFSEAGARYKKNHDFLRSSWWFSAFVKRGRPYKASATVMRECDSLLSEVCINTVQHSKELIYNIFRCPRQSSSSCRVDLNVNISVENDCCMMV